MLKSIHHHLVFQRRVNVLSGILSQFIAKENIKSIIDVGCGDGTISKKIIDSNPGLSIQGIDIMARPSCAIPFKEYDGHSIPFETGAADACMFVDVLHHLHHVEELLREASRAASKYIIIKDHIWSSKLDYKILEFMDNIGNKPHGVVLEYNYLEDATWKALFKKLNLEIVQQTYDIPLYPIPFQWVFGNGLHMITVLKKSSK